MSKFKEIISQIPKTSGVYIYKNREKDIIYIGKALNLLNRVRSYFTKNKDPKTKALVRKIDSIEYLVTNNEVEALLLENNLIKQHRPKYNIDLKDSKSYPFIVITNENLPRIFLTREKKDDNSEYFGPFVDASNVRVVISILKKYFKVRSCKHKFKPPYNYKPCLNLHIGKCDAPCNGSITEIDYKKTIDMARLILKGDTKQIVEILTKEMEEYSKNLEYEKASVRRDMIKSLRQLEEKQVVESQNVDNLDFIGFYGDYKSATISLIKQRNGKIVGNENFIINKFLNYLDVLSDFVNAYYLNNNLDFPTNIFVEEEIANKNVLIEALNKKFNIKVKIRIPSDAREKKILNLAKQNAEVHFEEKSYKIEKIHHLRELKKILNLATLPRRIECFDIATLNGKFNTAAMVSFLDGKPDKSEYRQLNIEGDGYPNDYAMMTEVIGRRYQKLKNEKLKFPDLIVVDGGKGQVTSALKSLNLLDLKIPVIGLAKKEEHIFVENKKSPLILQKDSVALKLLQYVRDEAHRFSNTRLNKRYKNSTLYSELLKIDGVGEKRANLLFRKFRSINKLKNASISDIEKVETIGKEVAIKIVDYLANHFNDGSNDLHIKS